MATHKDERSKYLAAIEEQEQHQQLLETQIELLRRALVRVSLAAEGNDSELDKNLDKLRSQLRKQDPEKMQKVLNSLDVMLVSYDERHSQNQHKIYSSVNELISSLKEMHHDKNALSRIRKLASSAKKLSSKPEILASLLSEIAILQGVLQSPSSSPAISAPSDTNSPEEGGVDENAGFFSRIFSRSNNENSNRVDDDDFEPEDTHRDSFNASISNTLDDGSDFHLDNDLPETPSAADPDNEAKRSANIREPEFSRISNRVNEVLIDLLDNVEPGEVVAHKAHAARERINRGLNWFELVPTLEDIRDIVSDVYLTADNEYKAYLSEVESELSNILATVGIVNEEISYASKEESLFEDTMESHLGALSQSMEISTEVAQLKQTVAEHLKTVGNVLSSKKVSRFGRDKKLIEKLAVMEKQVEIAKNEYHKAQTELEIAEAKALTDALTGLPNRQAYNERIHQEFSRWQRYNRPFSLMICDIDYFKRINDDFGHAAGDRVLQVLGKALPRHLRIVDFVARFGGEEFVVILPETDGNSAKIVAEKIRLAIEKIAFKFKDEAIEVTLSVGLTSYKEEDSIDSGFKRADKALYMAKEKGRNRAIFLSEDIESEKTRH